MAYLGNHKVDGVITPQFGGTGLTTVGTANQIPGVNSGATGFEYKTISGTTNRVTVTQGTNTITISAPQDLHSGASPSFAGMSFGGTGARITGDFSNATIANRLMFQTSTANGHTHTSVIPNGSGTASSHMLFSGADTANSSFAQLRVGTDVSEMQLVSSKYGTGTYLPLTFYTGGAERMRIDTNGNVGIGGALSASNGITNSKAGTSQVFITNTSGTTKNTQLVFSDSVGARWRAGVDVSTNNGTDNFHIYNDTTSTAIGTFSTTGLAITGHIRSQDNAWPTAIIGKTDGRCYVGGEGILILNGEGTSAVGRSSNLALLAGTTAGTIYASGVLLRAGNTDGTAATEFFDIRSANTGVVRLTLNSSGNLGLGVTPSAWDNNFKTMQLGYPNFIAGNNGGLRLDTGVNAYYSTNYKYAVSSVAATLYTQASGAHTWYIAPSGIAGNAITFTQAMTLDSSGNLLVGTTSSNAGQSGVLIMPSYSESGASSVAIQHDNGSSNGCHYSTYFYNATSIGSITQNGTTAVAYNTTSDYRLKTNVRPADAKRFMDIQFRDFEWVDGRHDCGVIAHELQAVYPDLITGEKDAVDADGKPVYQQVNYTGLICRMGAVIQQLEARLAALENK